MSVDPLAVIARVISSQRTAAPRCGELSLYVALGDSFTAGTGCAPGEAWPERLAAAIRPRNPSLELRNLAVEGATSADVLEQVPEAVELEPDLVTVVCGANDVLGSTRPDVNGYAANLETILGRLRGAVPGARIATATSPERWDFLPLGRRTRERVEGGIASFNRATRRLAAVHGLGCLDVARHPGLSQPENFSADGLHPSPLGHRRAAGGFGRLLCERYGIEISAEGGTR